MFQNISTLKELESACQQLYLLFCGPKKRSGPVFVGVSNENFKTQTTTLVTIKDISTLKEIGKDVDVFLFNSISNNDNPEEFEHYQIPSFDISVKEIAEIVLLDFHFPMAIFVVPDPFIKPQHRLLTGSNKITVVWSGPVKINNRNDSLVACMLNRTFMKVIREDDLVNSQNQFYNLLTVYPDFRNDVKQFVSGNPLQYSPDIIMGIIDSSVSSQLSDSEIYEKIHNELFPNPTLTSSETPAPYTVFTPEVQHSRSNKRVRQVADLLPKYFSPRSLLDIGCAEGSITGQLGQHWKIPKEKCCGCDVTPLRNETIDFSFKLSSGCTLPYDDQSFSLVTAFMSLHHIAVPMEMIKEVYRVLEPGGFFIIREHNVEDPPLAIFLDIVHGLYDQAWSNPKHDPLFFQNHWAQYYSIGQWENIITSIGFSKKKGVSDQRHVLRYYYDAYQKPGYNNNRVEYKETEKSVQKKNYGSPDNYRHDSYHRNRNNNYCEDNNNYNSNDDKYYNRKNDQNFSRSERNDYRRTNRDNNDRYPESNYSRPSRTYNRDDEDLRYSSSTKKRYNTINTNNHYGGNENNNTPHYDSSDRRMKQKNHNNDY